MNQTYVNLVRKWVEIVSFYTSFFSYFPYYQYRMSDSCNLHVFGYGLTWSESGSRKEFEIQARNSYANIWALTETWVFI